MNSAEHLLVLISIILGLAVTDLLVGARAAWADRPRAELSLLPFLAALLVLLIIVQFWWYLFIVAQRGAWSGNFFIFAAVLLRPALLFLSAASLFPPVGDRRDLAEHYLRNRQFVYVPLLLYELQNLIESSANLGSVWHPAHLFHIAFIAISGVLAWRSEPRLHLVVLAGTLVAALVFIAFFSLTLG